MSENLSSEKGVNLSELHAFVDNKCDLKTKICTSSGKTSCDKTTNCCYQPFLLFQQCFESFLYWVLCKCGIALITLS